MPEPQNLKNHTRFHPPFHFFLVPILLVDLAYSVWSLIRHRPEHFYMHCWWVVMAVALLLLALLTRMYALKAQDRIIRLEERLRMSALLPASELGAAYTLSERQLIALRFASDAELPGLVRRTLAENLTSQQIKQSIANWRADHFRI